ncbi:MAG: hypothetical protein P4L22_06075 [Candidatus Babeliales bacterium]|nr:hypothetical protein [Candidatus Babeliales bacterium]
MNKFKALIIVLTMVLNLVASDSSSSSSALESNNRFSILGSESSLKVKNKRARAARKFNHAQRAVGSESSLQDKNKPALTVQQLDLIQRLQSVCSRNYTTIKNSSIFSLFLIMYFYRSHLDKYYKSIRQIMQHTRFTQCFLTFMGGSVTLVCLAHNYYKKKTEQEKQKNVTGKHLQTAKQLIQEDMDKDGIIVRQVLQQNGLDSGYHAVKDGCYVYRQLIGDIRQDACLDNLMSEDDKIFKLKEWKNLVTASRNNGSGDTEDLSAQEIEALMSTMDAKIHRSEETNNGVFKGQKPGQKLQFLPQCFAPIAYTILSDLLKSNQLPKGLEETIESFRKDLQKIHLFILGEEYCGSDQWVSIVVENKKVEKYKVADEEQKYNSIEYEDNFRYYVMNSDDGYPVMPVVKKLKDLLENKN